MKSYFMAVKGYEPRGCGLLFKSRHFISRYASIISLLPFFLPSLTLSLIRKVYDDGLLARTRYTISDHACGDRLGAKQRAIYYTKRTQLCSALVLGPDPRKIPEAQRVRKRENPRVSSGFIESSTTRSVTLFRRRDGVFEMSECSRKLGIRLTTSRKIALSHLEIRPGDSFVTVKLEQERYLRRIEVFERIFFLRPLS